MNHIKQLRKKSFIHSSGSLLIEGPLSPEQLIHLHLHKELTSFRSPVEQHQALLAIAKRKEGRVVVVRRENCIIGYLTFVFPDTTEHWSAFPSERLIELGVLEIAPSFREEGIAKALILLAIENPMIEEYIVMSTEYYWHWDLNGTGLTLWEYRRMMDHLMAAVQFQHFSTTDPEVLAHPANCLIARIGKNVPLHEVDIFHQLRVAKRKEE